MTKREFENQVKEQIIKDGAKVVDMNTIKEKDGMFKGTYTSSIVAIRNHVAHRYSAWNYDDNEVIVKYSRCLM